MEPLTPQPHSESSSERVIVHDDRPERSVSDRPSVFSLVVISALTSLLVAVIATVGTWQYLSTRQAAVSSDQGQLQGQDVSAVMPGDTTIVDSVAQANPAVVSIVVSQDVPVFEEYYETYDPFGGLFGPGQEFRVPRRRQEGTEERQVSAGSGFFVSSDGLVVTNRHVVAMESARYSLVTDTGETYPVSVVARDAVLDIAVLRVTGEIPAEGFPALTFGDSNSLRLGQTVIAIGNALGEFSNSVSVGVVSGLSRSIIAGDQQGRDAELLEEVIQTDAAINPGNSGGPLLDIAGRVIGVNVAVARGSDNVGFALPASTVARIVESVATHGEIRRPFLGVRYQMLNAARAEALGLSVDHGAHIDRGVSDESAVQDGSPADTAGVEEGDVITQVGDISLRDRSLAGAIRAFDVGETVVLTIVRNGETIKLPVTLESATE